MKNRNPLKSPLLEQCKIMSAATDMAFDSRARSHIQNTVNIACTAEAEAIMTVASEGSLAEKIELECQLQQRDLQKYAASPADEKKIKQGLKDMEAGLASYADLTERPRAYKKQASHYTDRNRDAKLDVPKDAIASQITRLQNRQSLQLSDEEKNLLAARRALVHAIQEDYSSLQQEVVHG